MRRSGGRGKTPGMSAFASRITNSPWFQRFIITVILLAGVLVGVETAPALVAAHGHWLRALDTVVLGIFVLEIALKIAAEGKQPWRFFRDPFNVFDFLIVTVTLLPLDGQYITVLRLLRVVRVLRLVNALPELQILVSALLKSIPSMAYVGVFLGILFYVYGVAGVFLFGRNDPAHFGELDSAMLTLFTVVTLEGWAELMYAQLYGCDPAGALCKTPEAHPLTAPLYFVTFILFGTMIVLNLFIGVIMNSMQEAALESERAEQNRRRKSGLPEHTLHDELRELQHAAEQLAARALHLQQHHADTGPDRLQRG
jgi:voltage-gated sodium channel